MTSPRKTLLAVLGVAVLAGIAVLVVSLLADGGPSEADERADRGARNVVLFVGDGMGAAHRSLFRVGGRDPARQLAMNAMPVAGLVHTESATPDDVTDSAAAGTALATGVKTTNGSVGVGPDGRPVETVLERFAKEGRATGMVTTSQVTDATPAAFAAHVANRDRQGEIARQYLERSRPDVLLGGGAGVWRRPGADLVRRAEELGYETVTSGDALAASRSDQLLGLFADDRLFVPGPPGGGAEYDPAVSLEAMTRKALDVLGRDPEGFFLLVEEEAIDEMAHANNARLTFAAGRALDRAVLAAKRYAARHPDTLVLVTGDHETGGLSVQREPGRGVTTAWTTTEHTGIDVPLTAMGPGAEIFGGVYDNTTVPARIRAAAGIER